MLSFLIIFVGHFAYGITNVLWKNPRNKISTFPLIALRSLGCLLLFSTIFLFSDYKFPKLNVQEFLQIFGICIINSLGLVFYVQSMKFGNANKIVGLGKLNIVIWILISIFIFQENIPPQKIFLGILVSIGIFLVDSDKNKKVNLKPSKALIFTVLSRVFWSTAFLFIPYIKEYGILLFCMILELAVFSVSISASCIQRSKIEFKNVERKTFAEIMVLIILGCSGTLCLNFALAQMSIFLFAILALLEPIVGLLFARIYYKEKLEIPQIIGITMSLVSSFIMTIRF